MTVKELQTSAVKSCGRDTDLATVAKLMWDGDCGAVPVVTDDRKVIGMITDRDICIAAATRSRAPSEIRAREVITGNGVHAVKADDDVRVALRTMRKHRVRRLPVVDQRAAFERDPVDQRSRDQRVASASRRACRRRNSWRRSRRSARMKTEPPRKGGERVSDHRDRDARSSGRPRFLGRDNALAAGSES